MIALLFIAAALEDGRDLTRRFYAGETPAIWQRMNCGNSGNTTERHLHYHLQDSPRPFDGDGLPAEFTDYLADGKPVACGMPVQGQIIAPRAGR
jgi:hypothetical protein